MRRGSDRWLLRAEGVLGDFGWWWRSAASVALWGPFGKAAGAEKRQFYCLDWAGSVIMFV